jgi:hypothetical protein
VNAAAQNSVQQAANSQCTELKTMHRKEGFVDVVKPNTLLQQRKLMLGEQVAQLEEPAVLEYSSECEHQELHAVSRIRFPVPEKVVDLFQSRNILVLAQHMFGHARALIVRRTAESYLCLLRPHFLTYSSS